MIDKFDGDYAFLSNFYFSPIKEGVITYPTVEHYFQAQKTTNPETRFFISKAANPSEAKRRGRRVELRSDWEDIKFSLMERGLRAKFMIPELREKLLATGEEELVEGNWWGDTCWGVCNGVGENNLGKLLMKIREELRVN